MAKENTDEVKGQERQPLSPATRKRLQKAFEHASRQTAQSQFDYAAELLTQCVVGDPANILYVRSYIENYQKKYGNNRKGSSLAQFKELGARSAIKKALNDEHWDEVIRQGVKVLAVNPWDVPTLRAMASAAKHAGDGDCELYYLKVALEANIKDPETNKQAAQAMEERDQFDQAIACWRRVQQALPDNEEANKAIAGLGVKKMIHQGGYEKESKASAGSPARAAAGTASEELSEEERLRRHIAQSPQDIPSYLELVAIYLNSDDYDRAAEVLKQALEASGNDADVKEKLLDLEVRKVRAIVTEAREHRKESEAAEAEYRRLRKELNDRELEVCRFRCDRHPTNLRFKYDLGLRYQFGREHGEAIKQFQQAQNDPRCKGLCLLGLGQCFQAIKQGRLAMKHYEMAVVEIPDRDQEHKKEALYLAGKMALEELRDLELAEKYLTDLAGMDFSYRDVSALLDKVSQIRENQGDASPGAA